MRCIERFVQTSTDEVYRDMPVGAYAREESVISNALIAQTFGVRMQHCRAQLPSSCAAKREALKTLKERSEVEPRILK
jgi:hypothetical protein